MIKDAKKHMKEAFDLISAIPVSGNSVDLMASAKAKLRVAYGLLEEPKQDSEEVKDDG